MVPLFELGHCAVIFCGYPAEVVPLFDLVNDSGLSPALLYVLEHLGVKKLARAVEIERIRLRGEEWPGPGIRKIEYAGAAVPGDYVVGVLRVEQFDGFERHAHHLVYLLEMQVAAYLESIHRHRHTHIGRLKTIFLCIVESIHRTDERRHVAACLPRKIGVDTPEITLARPFDRLVYIARAAVV